MDEDLRSHVEDVIYTLAEIIDENRYLKKENERLKQVEKDYEKSINDRCKAVDQASINTLKAFCIGYGKGIKNTDLTEIDE